MRSITGRGGIYDVPSCSRTGSLRECLRGIGTGKEKEESS